MYTYLYRYVNYLQSELIGINFLLVLENENTDGR